MLFVYGQDSSHDVYSLMIIIVSAVHISCFNFWEVETEKEKFLK